MININMTLIVQLINFLVLLFILNRLMLQPILRLIQERDSYKNQSKEEIKDLEAKIEQVKEKFIQKESSIRNEAVQQRTEIMRAGMDQADTFLNESRKEVTKIRETAEMEAKNEIRKTQPLLEKQATSLVGSIIEKIIGRRVAV